MHLFYHKLPLPSLEWSWKHLCFLISLLRILARKWSTSYIRRGPTWFPDSGAAFIELSYLLSHGSVSLIENGEKLAWDGDRLYNGMVALAGELINVILRADVERATALLANHSF